MICPVTASPETGVSHRGAARWRVLFVCTGNSCRSQMAEGWTRALMGHLIEAHSAGVKPRGLDPCAVAVMAEAGVDISRGKSKPIDAWRLADFDYVITLSDRARAHVASSGLSGKTIHAEFSAPRKRVESEPLAHYRCVRDEIRQFILSLAVALCASASGETPRREHRPIRNAW